jgi:hypothetical protein
MQLATKTPAAMQKMREIQSEMEAMCKPSAAYSEFHAVTAERGFIRITVPKKK